MILPLPRATEQFVGAVRKQRRRVVLHSLDAMQLSPGILFHWVFWCGRSFQLDTIAVPFFAEIAANR